MDVGSRAASFASLSTAGSAVKLGFTSTTNTTAAITQTWAVSENVGQAQVHFLSSRETIYFENACAYTRKGMAVASSAIDQPSCNSFQLSAELACCEIPWITVQMEQGQLPAGHIALSVSQ
jgi:hypothetical protein